MNTGDASAARPGQGGRTGGHPGESAGVDRSELRARAREILAEHWLPEGYTMPNRATYPWQWLWDSCFHTIVWAELGDDRALVELAALFANQTSAGFVPHMGYHPDPRAALAFWGRTGASTITQPPMYGHAIAELVARGMTPPAEILDAAARGFGFLLEHRRRTAEGLIELCHPWESGCDDSARWDGALAEPWTRDRWRHRKRTLLDRIVFDAEGAAIRNDGFAVGSVGFNALVAFNALELDTVVDSPALRAGAVELAQIVASTWDPSLRTWVDAGALAAGSGRVRTADAHLALLVDPDPDHVAAAARELVDPAAFGAPFGPRGAHVAEPSFEPDAYWRGPAWPQISYLLWVALVRRGRRDDAAVIARSLRRGALESGFGEYWNPETARPGGAVPQSWSTLAVLVDRAGTVVE